MTRRLVSALLCGVSLFLAACGSDATFDGERAFKHIMSQCDLGPRYPGSEGARATIALILSSLEDQRIQGQEQEFIYREVTLRNVMAKLGEGRGPIVIVGTHYDTRRYADSDSLNPKAPVLGGNDGASGVAVLLELARCLDRERLENEVWFAFFDGEDQGGIENWPWSVGAEYMASRLDEQPSYVIIIDMIGDADQVIYWERNSDIDLQRHLWEIAAELGYQQHFVQRHKYSIIDDHIPFVRRGIVAVNMIDLDYPYWHTTDDTPDKVSPESLMRVGSILETMLERKPYRVKE